MEDLLTDQQQAEKVRSWVRENGMFLVAGVALGIGLLFGLNQWRHFEERQAEEASALYETFLVSARAGQLEPAESGVAALADQFSSSPYTDMARLYIARLYLDQGKADAAADALRKVAADGVSAEVRRIAQLRLARVLIYQEKYEEALKTVADPGSKTFAPLFNDVRGDVYVAMGKVAEARSAYEQALNGDFSAEVIERTYVQAKLDELGGATADVPALTTPSPAPAP